MSHHQTTGAQGHHAVCRMFDTSLCKMHYDLGNDRAPWTVAHFTGFDFSSVFLFDDQGIDGRKVLRNSEDIGADCVNDFLLALPRSAHISLAQKGRISNCAPGHAIIFSTALPFSSAIAALRPGGQYTQLLARLSGPMLRQRLSHVDLLTNHVFDVSTGSGRVLKSLLELGVAEGSRFSEIQSRHFGDMVLDAVANMLREVTIPDSLRPMGEGSCRTRLRQAALTFIERHLSQPTLDVEKVAAHCGVSERYLHTAFAEAGIRLGAHMRAMRLERARVALRDPVLRSRSVSEIALQWGYGDPGHFSRAYKAHFGVAPSDDRP